MPRAATKGHDLAYRWAKELGSQQVLASELVGPKTPFPEYTVPQALVRVLEAAGYVVRIDEYDAKRHMWSLMPNVVDQILSREQ